MKRLVLILMLILINSSCDSFSPEQSTQEDREEIIIRMKLKKAVAIARANIAQRKIHESQMKIVN